MKFAVSGIPLKFKGAKGAKSAQRTKSAERAKDAKHGRKLFPCEGRSDTSRIREVTFLFVQEGLPVDLNLFYAQSIRIPIRYSA